MLKVGDQAPDFTLPSHSGEIIQLSALRGSRVLLWFYPEAATPGCTAEGCGFRDRAAEFDRFNVKILGISFDTLEKNKEFAQTQGFPFPLLCDTERKVGLLYGACDKPSDKAPRRISYLIDEKGRITRAYPKVKAADHPQQVLADL